MENLENFIKKYIWKTIDFDWKYWFQCVDLIKVYISEIFWKNYGSIWNAKDYFWNLPEKDFDKIKFTWDLSVCKKWDIIIWDNSKWAWYWHIWIIVNFWKNFLEVLEQNWQNWNGKWKNWDEIRIKKIIDFSWIIGFCRFKILEKKEPTEFEKLIEEAKNLWIFNWKEVDKPASRWEIAVMCLNIYKKLSEKIKN